MPYINLKTLGKLTEKQKAQIAKEFTETLEKVANKPKNSVYIVIDEVERENWAVGGKLFSDNYQPTTNN
ncbi:MAG: 4-oxalocrotonate tautomerase [Bacteroidetes bacterium]|nr:MAG: 4-oxalocrotonate tautomerase [Bacteroidota bacterium]